MVVLVIATLTVFGFMAANYWWHRLDRDSAAGAERRYEAQRRRHQR